MSEVELRVLSLDDAGWVADLLTRCRPDDPTDPEVLRHRWLTQRPTWYGLRGGVIVGGGAQGFCAVWHAPWETEPERVGSWELSLLPAAQGLAGEVIDRLEDTLRREEARGLATEVFEPEDWLRAAVERRGYREVGRERQSELDLHAHGERLLALERAARAEAARRGFRVATLADVADRPSLWSRLTAFKAEVEADIPGDVPFHPDTEEEVRAELGGPDVRPERVWLVLDGERIAGLSYLTVPPVRGLPGTGLTASARAYRGRGAAWTAKLASLGQAIELGLERVRTGNHERNARMLAINRALGYVPLPGWICYRRDL
jgi:RimJ/RimL family protein N-acetyltransferase